MSTNIKLGISKLRPALLLAYFTNVIAKLTGNLNFPDLPIDLATLNAMAANFTANITRATQGSPSARAARNAEVLKVGATLTILADYVRMTSAGNAEMLASSGFPLSKQREPVGPIGTPMMKAAKITGIQGQTELIWTTIFGSHSFQVWQTESDPAAENVEWVRVTSTTRSRCVVNGLQSYKPYWFCVEALGSEGIGAKSAPIIGHAA